MPRNGWRLFISETSASDRLLLLKVCRLFHQNIHICTLHYKEEASITSLSVVFTVLIQRRRAVTMTSTTQQHKHPELGLIDGCRVTRHLIQFRSLPYALVKRRFARSTMLNHLPKALDDLHPSYDATNYGPCSIQSQDSITTDIRWNQLPECPRREQAQSEDCLRLTLTCPASGLDNVSARLPVVMFVHGGALMIGSGTLPSHSYTPKLTAGAEGNV